MFLGHSMVAFGGVGKTALVNHWLNLMQTDNYRGAQKVYGWSFYSQGAGMGTPGEFADVVAQYGGHALAGLRKYSDQSYLPFALLARGAYYRLMKEYDAARQDLPEACDIAQLGAMKLHLCDFHIQSALLCKDQGKNEEAEEHRQAARKLIEETGYHRRKV